MNLTPNVVDSTSIAGAIERLLSQPAEITRLAGSARARKFRTWTTYVDELTTWMRTLARRK